MDGIPTPHRPARSARRAASAESAPPRDDPPTPTSPPEQVTFPNFLVEMVPIEKLHPDPANPRRISDEELDALEKSLRQFGFVQPVVALRDGTVVGGHQRLVAARRLGYEIVPVTWADLSIEQAHLLGLALNKISGTWDEALLGRLLGDLQAVPNLDLRVSGFDEDEVAALLRSLEVREKRDRLEAFDLDDVLEGSADSPHEAR